MRKVVASTLVLAALLLSLASLGSGSVGFDWTSETTRFAVLEIRLPRVIAAFTSALGIASATALLQLALRSKVAEPALFGITAFSGLGSLVALSVGLGFGSLGAWALAVLFSLVGVIPLLFFARQLERSMDRNTESLRQNLPIIGVSLGAVAIAAVGLTSSLSPDPRLRSIALWAFGSFSLQTLEASIFPLGFSLVVVAFTLFMGKRLDKLNLGPSLLRGLGVKTTGLLLSSFALVAAASANASFSTGSIAFVGLLSITLGRLSFGARLGPLILGGSLIAVVVLLACDLLARTIAAPIELPLGLLTALVGAPLLIWSLSRSRSV